MRDKMHKRRFPMLAVILLVFAAIWLLSELKVIPTIDIPWIPIILIVVSIGLIYNRFAR